MKNKKQRQLAVEPKISRGLPTPLGRPAAAAHTGRSDQPYTLFSLSLIFISATIRSTFSVPCLNLRGYKAEIGAPGCRDDGQLAVTRGVAMIFPAQLSAENRQTTSNTSNTGAQQFSEAITNASASANGSPQGAQNGTGGPRPNPRPGPAPVAPRQSASPPWAGLHTNGQKAPPPPKITGAQRSDWQTGMILFGVGTVGTLVSGAYFGSALEGLGSASNVGEAPGIGDSMKSGLAYGATGPALMLLGLKLMTPVNAAESHWYETDAPNMPANPGA